MVVEREFQKVFGRRPEIVVRAPGRINLLGAHVDYNDGWVMPAAIDRAVWLAAAPGKGQTLRVRAIDFDAEAAVDLDRLPPTVPERNGGGSEWIDYPAGVAWALREAGHQPAAMDVAFTSDVPIGAGVSSSAAVEVAFLLAWRELCGLSLDGAEIPRLGRRAENGYLGVQSGIMDQFASLHGAADRVIFLDCRHLTFEHLPFPAATTVVVADSGVRRRLVGAETGYNDRPAECRAAVELLRSHLPGIRALRDVSADDYALHSHHLPMTLRRRVRHVVEECRRVREGADALRRGDVENFGTLVRQSHLSSRDLYEVSIPELDVLAAAAWTVDGCHGARMMGGGFGGCVAAVVADAAVGDVKAAMTAAFEESFGRRPDVFTCRVATGASVSPS
jgi:galactokinase